MSFLDNNNIDNIDDLSTIKNGYGYFTPLEASKNNSLNNLVIQSTTDESSNTKQFITYVDDPTIRHDNNNTTQKTEDKEDNDFDLENWSPANHFFIGSMTIIGLFLLFRFMQK